MTVKEMKRYQLEKERAKLHKLANEYGLSDDRVLQQSQLVDSMLNKYQFIFKRA